MTALLCLGCGEDLAQRAADRRALQGPPAEGVVDAWKAVFENGMNYIHNGWCGDVTQFSRDVYVARICCACDRDSIALYYVLCDVLV